MATILRSYWKGWRTATALWPVVVLLYVVDTALALLMATPPATRLAEVLGRSAMAPDLLGPVTLDLLIEASDGLQGFPLPWPLYLLVPLLSLLVGTFLRGGTLAALAGEPQAFLWTGFFSECARFFGRLLLLLLFLGPGLLVVGLLFFVGLLLLGAMQLPAPIAAGAALAYLGFLLLLLMSALDYSRISLVLEPERSVLWHLGRGLQFLARRFPGVVILGLGFAAAAAAIVALYPGLLQVSPFFGTILPALVLQQMSAFLGAWQRLAALGGEMALYRAR